MLSKIKIIFLITVCSSVFSGFVLAADLEFLPPPIINFYNKQISNNEIFYISGSATLTNADVIIYFQQEDGGLFSEIVKVDEFGKWGYYHPKFLTKGSYMIWTQLRADDLSSPPSPQIKIQVESTALQVGSVRIGYDKLSFILATIMMLFTLGLIFFIIHHYRHHYHKSKVLNKELMKAEAMIFYGFQSLKKDVLAELELLRKSNNGLSPEIQEKESQIIKDLEVIDTYLQKEFNDLESIGNK